MALSTDSNQTGMMGLVVAAFAVAFALTAFSSDADASALGRSPYHQGLSHIDSHLRFAIETGPSELAEDLRSSELVCGLGQAAEERGDSISAAADWSTAHQGIEEIDIPAAARIDRAFGLADADLRALRSTFAAAWIGQRPRVRELNRGVSRALRGVRLLRSAMGQIEAAFPAWNEHRCSAATEAIEAGAFALPAGLEQVNAGVLRLWRLLKTPEAVGSETR